MENRSLIAKKDAHCRVLEKKIADSEAEANNMRLMIDQANTEMGNYK